ncbi:uncharacterized protein LOC134534276 [Bacillus rossius redtenbacheri]|uniref:uncharacterized protein LOC134534276 n=1 Tax=Bacillus rossius redtenbacheri TaxID=93214 RepID=UPI002FDEAC77
MAKFKQPYVLCPLIGQRTLLGVANDEDNDCVIATLGKNMIVRYKLQNQKQIGSWATKDKLTSPVIYDPVGGRYVGVFAHSQLRLWSESEERLEAVKKHKFQTPIHCVLAGIDAEGPVVVFQSGLATPLAAALEARKNAPAAALLKPGEAIQDCRLVVHEGIKQVAILAKTPKGRAWCYTVPVSEDWASHRFELARDDAPDARLAGHAFASDGTCRLFSLWSDGRLFVQPAVTGEAKEALAVLTAVSTANPVSMLPLSASQLALYGADPSEEGAVLVVFNVRFALVQCQQHLKLFSNPPLLWGCGQHLLMAVGSNLLVVPCQLEPERLAAVLGSHRSLGPSVPPGDVELVTELREASWGPAPVPASPALAPAPPDLARRLQQLEATGCPQASMAGQLLPELLAAGDEAGARWCLLHLGDVPEAALVGVLEHCLGRGEQRDDDALLAAALGARFSEAELRAELRRLPLDLALGLVRALLASPGHATRWLAPLLDAHYQGLLLARDPRVLAALDAVRRFVSDQLAQVTCMRSLLPLIEAVRSGKQITQNQRIDSLYSIKRITLC